MEQYRNQGQGGQNLLPVESRVMLCSLPPAAATIPS